MEYKLKSGNTLIVEQEEFYINDNPREWDNLSKMVFFGKHKGLGDNHNITLDVSFDSRHDFMERGAELIRKELDAAIVKPVHLYEHSGMSISTNYSYPYDCRWDSGTIGFAVVTKEAIRKEYGVKRITKSLIEKANSVLDGEVKLLDQYIRGEIYRYRVINPEGDEIDSCGSYFGHDITENGILDNINDELAEK